MAYIKAAQNGNFSSPSTWGGGVVPTTGDYACTLTNRVVLDIDTGAHLCVNQTDWVAAGGAATASFQGGFDVPDGATRVITGSLRYDASSSLNTNTSTTSALVLRNGNLTIDKIEYVSGYVSSSSLSKNIIHFAPTSTTPSTLTVTTSIDVTRGNSYSNSGYYVVSIRAAGTTSGMMTINLPELILLTLLSASSSYMSSVLHLDGTTGYDLNMNGNFFNGSAHMNQGIINVSTSSTGVDNQKININTQTFGAGAVSSGYGIYANHVSSVFFSNNTTINSPAATGSAAIITVNNLRGQISIPGTLTSLGFGRITISLVGGNVNCGNVVQTVNGSPLLEIIGSGNTVIGDITTDGSSSISDSYAIVSISSVGTITVGDIYCPSGALYHKRMLEISGSRTSETTIGSIDLRNVYTKSSTPFVLISGGNTSTTTINGSVIGPTGGSTTSLDAAALSLTSSNINQGSFIINGDVKAGVTGPGLHLISGSQQNVTINGTVFGADYPGGVTIVPPAVYSRGRRVLIRNIDTGADGRHPVDGLFAFIDSATAYYKGVDQAGALVTLSPGTGTIPDPSDVRDGVAVGSATGTLVVPDPATVLVGVNYGDSLIGTLNIPGLETINNYQAARYWRIYMTANNGDTHYSLQEVQVIGTDGTTVRTSPTTTVDASSFYDGGSYQANASKLVDGDENNGELGVWASSGLSTTEWVSFDFTFPVGVSKFRILPQAYAPVSLSRSPSNYQIQWSDDNTNWTTVKTITGDASWAFDTYKVIDLDPISVESVSITDQLDRIEDKVNGIPPISLNVEAIKTQTDKLFFGEVTTQEATGDTNWDDTVLLIHGNDGTIIEEKSHTINNVSVTSNTNQAMTAGGSSMEFDQTNYLSLQHADFVFGTGDFTVEFWIYRSQISQGYGSFFSNGYHGAYGGFNIRQSGGGEQIEVVTGWSNAILYPTISTPLNEWIHIALTRETGLMRIFMNGQFGGSIAASDNYTHDTLYVGTDGSYFASISNIVDLRVTKVCRYSSSFTPPESLTHAPGTQPVTETHVKALTSSTGTGTNYDADFLEINNKLDLLATNISEIEVIANKFSFTPVYKPEDPFLSGVAFIENYNSESIGSVYGFSPTVVSGVPYTTTAQKRLGTRSLACDGNVIINYGNITAMDVGANDFTIEFSAFFNNTLAGNPTAFGGIMGKRENTNFAWTIYVSNGHLTFLTSAGAQPYSFTHSLELTQFEWADVALSRTGNTLKFYINGQMESAEVPGMELNNVSSTFIIGALNIDTLDHFFHGYLDRIRFTAGTGRYNTIAPLSPPIEYSTTPIGTNQIDYYKVNSNPGEVDTTTIDRIEDRVLDLKARLRAIHFIMEQ